LQNDFPGKRSGKENDSKMEKGKIKVILVDTIGDEPNEEVEIEWQKEK
jgi:hypothetical protein